MYVDNYVDIYTYIYIYIYIYTKAIANHDTKIVASKFMHIRRTILISWLTIALPKQ